MKTIGFIGLGKLGLPIAETIATKGYKVIGFDIKPVTTSLVLASSIKELVIKSDIVFCAVQTPHDPLYEGDKPIPKTRADFDYSYLTRAIREVVSTNKKITLVVISTCLPGTFNRLIKPILTNKINYLYNPFFIAMGTVVEDFLNPEFVLVGGNDPKVLKEFYLKIYGKDRTFITDVTTAEGIKVFYNTFVTTKTVLGNMYGEFAYKLGMNVDHIYEALTHATDRLISPKYLKSGMGDGGGCFPPSELVMTKQGMRPIETISRNMQVLTSDGTFQKVIKLWERNYKGNLVSVQVRGIPKVRMTIEHPVITRADGRNFDKIKQGLKRGKWNTYYKILDKLLPIKETRADQLTLTHLVGWPHIDEYVSKPYPTEYLKLAGWYLSEGSAELSTRRGRLRFDLHQKEGSDAQDIESWLKMCAIKPDNNRGSGARITHKIEDNKRSVRFGNMGLTKQLVDDFGEGAATKKIPESILWGNLKQIELILWGLIRGDGHRGIKGVSYSTISQDLAWGVFVMLHRLGLNPNLRNIPPRGIHKRAFEVRVRNRRLANKLCQIVGWEKYNYDKEIQTTANDGQTSWRHIQSIENEYYDGKVYNLWVDGNHTYVVSFGAVHNCHPRDNIALSYLAEKTGMSFNFFDSLMQAREKHTEWLADVFIKKVKESKLPGMILGKSFKPGVDIQTGSAAILLANILKEKKVRFDHYEFDFPEDLTPSVYFIATRHGIYKYLPFPKGSIVIDPFRYIPSRDGVNVIGIGKKNSLI